MKKAGIFAALAMFAGAGALATGSAGLAFASSGAPPAAPMSAPTSSSPPGNNGTIKIDQTPLVQGGTVDHSNHPHVQCQFALSFFGFDSPSDTATVTFTAQPPSGQGTAVTPTMGPSTFSFPGSGAGGSLDISVPYELDVSGLTLQPQQGYHIKVSVDVDGVVSHAADSKYKVFWYEPCATGGGSTTTLAPTSTTLASGSGGLGGSTTIPSTTIPSTTVPTSTTLLSGSGGLSGSTTTVPTGGRGQAPPTGGQSPLASGQSQLASGQAPDASGQSHLVFTSGQPGAGTSPIPAGAATDLGFFKPGSWLGSSAPWILMILGGVLLMGTGAFGLLSRRITSATR